MDKVRVLHLPRRKDRYDNVVKQFAGQNAEFILSPGIESIPAYRGITLGHQRIVRRAKENALSRVVIAEDDIDFLGEGALQYFFDNEPPSYDLYLGGFFNHQKLPSSNLLISFEGMTLYMVHERFYDIFLSIPPDGHIDNSLTTLGIYKACPKIVAGQIKSYSDNKKCLSHPSLNDKYPIYGLKLN